MNDHPMSATNSPEIEIRLRRLERQNRLLVTLLCVSAGLALLGATKAGPNVLTTDELRTHRISLVNDEGQVVHSWRVAHGWVIEQ
jgi:hypothetical protein